MSWNMKRKKGHIDVCMHEDVSYHKTAGFERYELMHSALPEIDFAKISTDVTFLDKTLRLPLIISGMTGGPKLSEQINANLAKAAEQFKVAMGVGSQRVAIEEGQQSSFEVRQYFSGPLLSNLGAVQLNYGFGVEECTKAVESISADALFFHLNSMQEIIQQGNTDWSGITDKIAAVCKGLKYPVLVKEVGFGISKDVGLRLKKAGVHGIDVAGAGGTSWTAVESYLAQEPFASLGHLFWDWGIPTAKALEMNKDLGIKIIAGGGVRTGLDIAKAIALGADYVSMAGPLLKPAMQSPEAVVETLERLHLELRTAMFGVGVKDIASLKKVRFYERP